MIVAPGGVKTPIWDKAEEVEDAPGLGTPFEKPMRRLERGMMRDGRNGLEAAYLGEVVHTALTDPSPKWRYALARDKFKSWTVPRLLPTRIVDRMLGKRLGLVRQPRAGAGE